MSDLVTQLRMGEATRAEAAEEIERLKAECDGWQKLTNDAERAIGMDSVATCPEARSLVEWCDEKRQEIERLTVELHEAHRETDIIAGDRERLVAENEGYREMLSHVRSERDEILRERNEFDKEIERLQGENNELREHVIQHGVAVEAADLEIKRLKAENVALRAKYHADLGLTFHGE